METSHASEEILSLWQFYLSNCSIHVWCPQRIIYRNYIYVIWKNFWTVLIHDSRSGMFATPPPPIVNHKNFSRTVIKAQAEWGNLLLCDTNMLKNGSIPREQLSLTHAHTHPWPWATQNVALKCRQPIFYHLNRNFRVISFLRSVLFELCSKKRRENNIRSNLLSFKPLLKCKEAKQRIVDFTATHSDASQTNPAVDKQLQ